MMAHLHLASMTLPGMRLVPWPSRDEANQDAQDASDADEPRS